jgi:hypothetical protein
MWWGAVRGTTLIIKIIIIIIYYYILYILLVLVLVLVLLRHNDLAGFSKSTGLTDQAFLIRFLPAYTACVKYDCFLH